MRTPLHAISSYTKLGIDRVELWDTQKQQENLGKIRINSVRLTRMIDNLLFLTQIDTLNNHLSFRAQNVGKIISASINDLKATFPMRCLNIVVSDAIKQTDIYCDDLLLTKALVNLLDNACRYSDVETEVSLFVAFEDNMQSIVFEIFDQGVGIPKGQEEHIFDKFTQSSLTDTGRGGTGIGLALVKAVVEAHKGTLAFRENTPKGTVFSIKITL
jgi:K+-sensing histidine kinase KdpD